MKKTILASLLTANAVLGGTLVWRATSGVAAAQPMPQAPLPGKYLMVPGYSGSLNASIVYVFDSANRRLGAIAPDARENFSTMRPIALDPIFDNAQASGAATDPVRRSPGRGGPPSR